MMKNSNLENQVQNISKEAVDNMSQAEDSSSLYQLKVKYLGKQGQVTALMSELKNLPQDQKPEWGKKINLLKELIEDTYQNYFQKLKDQERLKKISEDRLDLSLPGPYRSQGGFHPIEKIIKKTVHIFEKLGYVQVCGPLIETDWYNFSALNVPADHPSRDMNDTFYLKNSQHLLRTHTSPVQIRSLENLKPPMAVIAPGPVFRRDHPDSSHSPYFHQAEGLFIDRKVSMSHLKGTLSHFLKELHGSQTRLRFRLSFFPFTEPSAEYDCSCFLCDGKGCSLCKNSGWIEMGGAGLVHPHVLKACGVDPDKWQGFAFGMGMDRLALLRYGVPDIRFFYENRMDFLNQFEDK